MGRRPILTTEKVLVALRQWTAAHGDPPSLEQLRRALRVGSTRTLFRYLRALEDEGAIERHPGVPGVKLLKPSAAGLDTRAVPIIGDVQAGTPTLAAQNIDGWLRLPESFTGRAPGKLFLLRVRGTSMNDATLPGGRIENGDLVLVRQQAGASAGDIVVAVIDGDATLKRLVAAPGYLILKPESTDSRHQPIAVEGDFRLQGKALRVLKKGSRLLESLFDW